MYDMLLASSDMCAEFFSSYAVAINSIQLHPAPISYLNNPMLNHIHTSFAHTRLQRAKNRVEELFTEIQIYPSPSHSYPQPIANGKNTLPSRFRF